ncbi:hypothetical protein PVL29_004787 [Vitis rotundifolia]|uniref:Uncharacterized protein n=1 Tax=Vitis rotundifolia TaxID=103349 RepID=A0AA39AB62_VITRO|nr:hypothetical protein PVL29_004787 [Vitis rotundifolia]
MTRRIELRPHIDAVETGAVAAIWQHPENFLHRLGVEEDGDENKEAAAIAAAILSLRSSMVVLKEVGLMDT